jgi:dihydroxyacetone kinase
MRPGQQRRIDFTDGTISGHPVQHAGFSGEKMAKNNSATEISSNAVQSLISSI